MLSRVARPRRLARLVMPPSAILRMLAGCADLGGNVSRVIADHLHPSLLATAINCPQKRPACLSICLCAARCAVILKPKEEAPCQRGHSPCRSRCCGAGR